MIKSTRSTLARELYEVHIQQIADLSLLIDQLMAEGSLLSTHLLPYKLEMHSLAERVREEIFSLPLHQLELLHGQHVRVDETAATRFELLPTPLTETESSVLSDLIKGLTTSEIARGRHNSQATIKSHLTSIYRKLGVRNRVEAVTWATREES
jgi:DNA-binding NarL/FixJ family response regulator